MPWAKPGSRFTEAFEEMVAYLSQVTDRTKVRELTGISWTTVGSIIERVVQGRLDPDRLQGLRRIGIDEFSYRKRHRYITVIVDHQRRRVVWAAEGRTAKVLGEFFKLLGEEGRASIDSVTIDMAGSYKKAIREWIPHATVIYDRFHVQRLASKAVDEVRRAMARDLRGLDEEQRKTIKNTRYVLLKNPWHLTPIEQQRLAEVQRTNKKLYRAYLLKETLAHALDYRQPARARRALEEWLAWASRSRLKPFVRLARTLRQHREGVPRLCQKPPHQRDRRRHQHQTENGRQTSVWFSLSRRSHRDALSHRWRRQTQPSITHQNLRRGRKTLAS